jgi:hypothetical protein
MAYNGAMQVAIDIPQAAIRAFCQRHHIRRNKVIAGAQPIYS